MLAIAAGTFIFSAVMAPVRILVFCLVAALYSSCLVTFGVLARDLDARWVGASGSSPSLWCSSLRVAFGVLKYANSIKRRSTVEICCLWKSKPRVRLGIYYGLLVILRTSLVCFFGAVPFCGSLGYQFPSF